MPNITGNCVYFVLLREHPGFALLSKSFRFYANEALWFLRLRTELGPLSDLTSVENKGATHSSLVSPSPLYVPLPVFAGSEQGFEANRARFHPGS